MNKEIAAYHKKQTDNDKAICNLLYDEICKHLPKAENKIWHAHPVWFLDGNPIVGYSRLKNGIRLMFWSGASFDEKQLIGGTGKFKDAYITYISTDQINKKDLKRWLKKAVAIQWDYKNIVKRKGVLFPLKGIKPNNSIRNFMKHDSSGYSGTPLAKKLAIKDHFKIRLIEAPKYYMELFSAQPPTVEIVKESKSKKNLIHYFVNDAKKMKKTLPALKKELQPDGMIWVSWYKKSAKLPTDITEDLIRAAALRVGLVDVKVCAVDEKWSGLKLVIPVKLRSFK